MKTTLLALRFAWRDLRGGLRGFGVFIACITLGVTAIAAVGSSAASLAEGIVDVGRVILGGDMSFSLVQRQASGTEHAFLDAHGAVSTVATLRAMARVLPPYLSQQPGKEKSVNPSSQAGEGRQEATLVEVKAVDSGYPLFGKVVTNPALPLSALLAQSAGTFGAAVDPSLLTRLNLKLGDHIAIGKASIALRAVLVDEPDRLASRIGFGPRVLLSAAALRASGLIQPGSLLRWFYRLRLPTGNASNGAIASIEKQAQAAFPHAGWEIRTRDKASPQLQRSIARFTQFLALVALTALIVGGVGVANAVASQLNGKRDAIATMKALGATGGDIFAIYCAEIVLVALFATAIGAGLGAGLPFVASHWLDAVIPLPVAASLHPSVLALAIVYGLSTALTFALWPLGRAHDTSVSMLFRDQIDSERRWPRPRYMVATALIVAIFAALAVLTTDERRIAAIFLASTAAIFLILRVLALLLMAVARRLPRQRSTSLRLAIANIHRPGALTPTVMLSLGLGLALLTAMIEIDGNLHREFTAALPDKAPSFFFLDIQSSDQTRFDAFVRAQAPGSIFERAPMLRGRIVAANGINVADLKPAAGSGWVLRADRGITYSRAVPAGSRVVAGRWWNADYVGKPLVSLEAKTARDLNLKLGENITINVLGRDITARIANLRAVDWENLGINFLLVFSPGTFPGAPHSDIATLTFADGGTVAEETAFVSALADAFPTVAVVRVKEALDTVDTIVRKLILALRGASSITLIAAAAVLGGALAATQRFRIYDAVLLKIFGATRVQLLGAYAIEYLLIGSAAVVFGIAAGSLAAELVVTRVMEFPFVWVAGQAAGAAFLSLLVTLVLGLAGTFAALGRKPAEVLRNL